MPGFIGVPELLLLGLVALLVFGPKRLPEMGRSLGHGLREFKDSVTGSDGGKADEASASTAATATATPTTTPTIAARPEPAAQQLPVTEPRRTTEARRA